MISVSKERRYRIALFINILLLVIVFATGYKGVERLVGPLISPLIHPVEPLTMTPTDMPDLQGMMTKNLIHKLAITQAAAEFMTLDQGSSARTHKELTLLKFLKNNKASAADFILASEAVSTRPARAYVMEALWNMRQTGKLLEFQIFPMSDTKIAWAKEQDIDPRMLAIATDVYGATFQLVHAAPELFFEAATDRKARLSQLDNYLPNPAVLARLQMIETGWKFDKLVTEFEDTGFTWDFPVEHTENMAFVNIGTVTAWDALNLSEEWFPSGHDDLLWISQVLEENTGLPYRQNVVTLPGSARGSGDGSGGAIGPQFMPLNARLFMSWYNAANAKLDNILPYPNPFNPWSAAMLSNLYLTSEFHHRQMGINNVTKVVRPGYVLAENVDGEIAFTRKDPRMKALLKWNPLLWEAKAAVEAGEKFTSVWLNERLAMIKN